VSRRYGDDEKRKMEKKESGEEKERLACQVVLGWETKVGAGGGVRKIRGG
jgi:hypothetical protein